MEKDREIDSVKRLTAQTLQHTKARRKRIVRKYLKKAFGAPRDKLPAVFSLWRRLVAEELLT